MDVQGKKKYRESNFHQTLHLAFPGNSVGMNHPSRPTVVDRSFRLPKYRQIISHRRPWGWYIYLHLLLEKQLNVGKYTIHGSYGWKTGFLSPYAPCMEYLLTFTINLAKCRYINMPVPLASYGFVKKNLPKLRGAASTRHIAAGTPRPTIYKSLLTTIIFNNHHFHLVPQTTSFCHGCFFVISNHFLCKDWVKFIIQLIANHL